MNSTMSHKRERSHFNSTPRGLRGGVNFTDADKADPDGFYWQGAFETARRQLDRSLNTEQLDIWSKAWNDHNPETKTFRECYELIHQARMLAEAGEDVVTIIEEVLG